MAEKSYWLPTVTSGYFRLPLVTRQVIEGRAGEQDLFRARRRRGVPAGGALDDVPHAVEPEGGELETVLTPCKSAAERGVLNAEFELWVTIYFHFHGTSIG